MRHIPPPPLTETEIQLHEIADGYLVEEDGVLGWQIKWDGKKRCFLLYRFSEERGLVYVDSGLDTVEFVDNIKAKVYDL